MSLRNVAAMKIQNPGVRSAGILISPRYVLVLALVAACKDTKDSQVSDARPTSDLNLRESVCAIANADQSVSPGFDLIQTIFNQSCVSCHTTGADLDLSAGAAWGALVNKPAPSAEQCGGTLVVPRNPDTSYLFVKLSGEHLCSGIRMPRGEFGSEPLPDCIIALVRSWIAGGANGPMQDAGGE